MENTLEELKARLEINYKQRLINEAEAPVKYAQYQHALAQLKTGYEKKVTWDNETMIIKITPIAQASKGETILYFEFTFNEIQALRRLKILPLLRPLTTDECLSLKQRLLD